MAWEERSGGLVFRELAVLLGDTLFPLGDLREPSKSLDAVEAACPHCLQVRSVLLGNEWRTWTAVKKAPDPSWAPEFLACFMP